MLTWRYGLNLGKAQRLNYAPLGFSRNVLNSIDANQNKQKELLIREKYAKKIEIKLKQKGLDNFEDLKKSYQDQIKLDQDEMRKQYQELIQKARIKNHNNTTNQLKQQSKQKENLIKSSSKNYSSPIKPLDSIINFKKIITESSNEISKLWTAYHLSTSNPPRLGAVIPTQIYKEMIQFARKYPNFVIPLAKPSNESTTELPPFEMQYLQWDFFKSAQDSNQTDLLNSNLPSSTLPTTTVMFTPLAEYKIRQSYAQPTLILTHYTDLSDSHGIVLMRGDITPSSHGSKHSGKITTTDAQLLVLRLQQFYYPSKSTQENHALNQKRKSILQSFHEKPDQFQLNDLLNLTKDL